MNSNRFQFPKVDGKVPLKLLLFNWKYPNCDQSPRDGEMVPENRLPATENQYRLVHFPNDDGSVPVKALFSIWKSVIWLQPVPMVSGSDPLLETKDEEAPEKQKQWDDGTNT